MPPCKKEKLDHNKCVVPNCNNGRHNNYTLFKIPRHPDRRKMWLEVIGNPSLMECSSTFLDKAGVCKNHFFPESFMNAEKKKLRPYANPVNLNMPQLAQLRESNPNLSEKPNIKEEQKVSESTQVIYNTNYDNNNTCEQQTSDVEIMDLSNLPPWPASPVKMVKVNDESYVSDPIKNESQTKEDNVYFKFDEGVVTNASCCFKKNVTNSFNGSVNGVNLNFQNNGFQYNCALKDNLTQAFEKPPTVSMQKEAIDDALGSKKMKEIISVLEEENMMLKKKLRKFEVINKERNELLYKYNALQKKTAKQEEMIIRLCKEINSMRK